jgi:F0F1-type ATP synthase assembly protein I
MIVGALLVGYWVDRKLGTSPTFTLIGLGVGTFGGFWTLFKTARQLTKDMAAEDAARARRERRRAGDDPGSER